MNIATPRKLLERALGNIGAASKNL
jgi:hypothetical protein